MKNRGGKEKKTFEKIMAPDFPNLIKTISLQIQQVQLTSITRRTKITTSRYTIVKLLKTSDKEKILNTTRVGRKVILYMEKQKIRKTTGFS